MQENAARHTTFEEILERDGKLVYKARGTSMKPFIYPERDLVVIRKRDGQEGRLRPMDAALYKKKDKYILHRVIRVEEDSYVFRGDNTFFEEKGITDADILGVLDAVIKNGRTIRSQGLFCRVFVRVWHLLYPLRALAVRLRIAWKRRTGAQKDRS